MLCSMRCSFTGFEISRCRSRHLKAMHELLVTSYTVILNQDATTHLASSIQHEPQYCLKNINCTWKTIQLMNNSLTRPVNWLSKRLCQTTIKCSLTIDNSCVATSFKRIFSGILIFALWVRSTPVPPGVAVPGFCPGRFTDDLTDGSRLSKRCRSRDTLGGFSGTDGCTPSIASQWATHQHWPNVTHVCRPCQITQQCKQYEKHNVMKPK